MARFHGYVGYLDTEEVRPGVHMPKIVERECSGDILQYGNKVQAGVSVIDDPVIMNRVSFLADPYAREHSDTIKYVVWMGTLWNVTAVSVEFPRLILTLGGVYTGERPSGTT